MREEIINIIKNISESDEIINNPEINLLESGLIDSVLFIELVEELEEKFNIEIQLTQVESSTWESLDKIVLLVESLI